MIKTTSLFAAGFLAATGVLPAQSPKAPTPPSAAAASPAASPAALAVEDLDALRAHVGQIVDVRGTPTATGHNKSGSVAYLNFGRAHQALSVVAFLSAGGSDGTAGKVQSEDDLKAFLGKAVLVHGKVADYKGDLQIVLDTLGQITVAP